MSVTTVARTSPSLGRLIGSIRAVVRIERDASETSLMVADLLRPALDNPYLLLPEQRQPDPTQYRQHILHVEPDGSFSIVALVWLPGQVTPIHDHVSWCVVGVHQGGELETRYVQRSDDDGPYLLEAGQSVNPVGSVAALCPPGDIHRVANSGHGLAISLHVYGADIGVLGSSIRRRYDLPVRDPAA